MRNHGNVKSEDFFSVAAEKGEGWGHFCPELFCVGARVKKKPKEL